jgi:DNA-binding response OmpR family regulator
VKKQKILVIDDEPTITDGLRLMLEDAGYTVQTASEGKYGIELFES